MVDTVKFPASLFSLLLLLYGVSSYTEFEITVPSAGQVGVYGQAVVLSCSFPVGSSWDVGSAVITWQRNLEVVHSFYHGQDQLDRQSCHYVHRTSLYHEEMSKGNASLRLERVTPKDEGVYTCLVSTQRGSQKKSFKLKVTAEFEITVPSAGQVGVYRQSVVLSCSFPVGSSWDVGSAVITWQRNLEVVHSFYHGQDQLDRQSRHYAHRTSLYHEEMSKGNASLRLERVTLEDEGVYTCSVSTQIGSQKKSFKLKVAAFYPEPHLHISLLHNGQVDLLLTSQGGYPSPSLQWLIGNTEDVTEVTQTQLEQDENTKLYSVNSKLNLTRGTNSSITFILKNEDLGQEIRRNIDLFSENEETDRGGLRARHELILGVLLLLVMLTLVAVFTVIFRRRKQNKLIKKDSTRTTELSKALNGCSIENSPC